MTSSTSSSRSRNPSSGPRSTPDRFANSSSFSSNSAPPESDSRKPDSGRNPLTVAVRSIAGAFISCFTPPETAERKNLIVSNESRTPSVSSEVSRTTSGRRGSNGGIYSNARKESGPGNMKFTMDEILKATRNFSPAFKVGQGGFGTVYKGRLDDGSLVAIKRAKSCVYDKHLGAEFQSEVTTLAQVEHLNLVKFYGYLEQGDERILVVEYVTNGTLREHLDGVHGKELDFAARLDIAIDIAHAITYLHMLAADMDSGATHVSTQVKGTAGYLDPEYLRTYQLTEKSDVYSFGVLLVELVTGRRPIESKREHKERITPRWAMKKFTDGDAISALDPCLEPAARTNLALEKILELALQCLAPRRQSRPSMRSCGEVLWSIRKDYREQSALGFRSLSSSQRSVSVKEE
ncbi:Calmodulin-binding receptor-like cytoplasmic kinase 2 [Hibiscus syriacus]|uniref:Calmodulin-binding receptor-like cytoplasmic kinase 2 n=1 Tax=Hibiscus syriacus TaxID=106335 RepID=A0A6A2Y814_HIBSY|nr:Calmodulin-binding receptor-like cytoplasmic kinase 2 [Hibiscus syriacus]